MPREKAEIEIAIGQSGGRRVVIRSPIPSNAPKGWDLKGKSLDQIVCEARALGVSYGMYVSACNFGTVERLLANRGITDGLKRISRAWRERQKKGRCDFTAQHPITK